MLYLSDYANFFRKPGSKDKKKRNVNRVLEVSGNIGKRIIRPAAITALLGAGYLANRKYLNNLGKQALKKAEENLPSILGNSVATAGLLTVGGLAGHAVDDIMDNRNHHYKRHTQRSLIGRPNI